MREINVYKVSFDSASGLHPVNILAHSCAEAEDKALGLIPAGKPESTRVVLVEEIISNIK